MKTFVVTIITKSTFNAYFNTIKAHDYITACDNANVKFGTPDVFVSVVPPVLIPEIKRVFSQASE